MWGQPHEITVWGQPPSAVLRSNAALFMLCKTEKAISEEIAFCKIRARLRVPERFQLASPWDPWSHRTAPSGPPAGS